jgi:hypothetical protein
MVCLDTPCASGRPSGFGRRSIALEMYARQANDTELERQVRAIRVRAERACGEMLREREMAKGAREPGTNRGVTRSGGSTASTTSPKTLAATPSTRCLSSLG